MLLDTEQMRRRLVGLEALERRLSFRMSRTAKLLDQHASRQLEDVPLNLTGYRILMVLSVMGETTAADLSRLMVVDRAHISRAVGELVASGTLRQRPDPASRRNKLLSLTDAGNALMDAVRPRYEARQDQLCAVLSDHEIDVLFAVLDKLSRQLAVELEQPDATPVSAIREDAAR